MEWATAERPNMILDDGGDATLLVLLALKLRSTRASSRTRRNEEEEALYARDQERLQTKPGYYARLKERSRESARRRRLE